MPFVVTRLNPMNKKIKNLFFVILAVTLLAAVSGCETKKSVQDAKMDIVQEETNSPETIQTETNSSETATSSPEIAMGTSTEDVDTSNWKTYRNENLGFEIKYPNFWILSEASNENFEKYGRVAQFQTPDTDELVKTKKLHPSESYNLVIQYWTNMNNEYARNGTSIKQREYNGLEDFFTDTKFITKHSIGEIILDNHTAYEVIIGGYGSNYGIMIEKNGIYELSFPRVWDKSELGEIEKKIISSFKFIE